MLRVMVERSKTRKAVSIALGVTLAAAGAGGFLYMFFTVVEPVKLIIWAVPAAAFATGVAILWDDLKES